MQLNVMRSTKPNDLERVRVVRVMRLDLFCPTNMARLFSYRPFSDRVAYRNRCLSTAEGDAAALQFA